MTLETPIERRSQLDHVEVVEDVLGEEEDLGWSDEEVWDEEGRLGEEVPRPQRVPNVEDFVRERRERETGRVVRIQVPLRGSRAVRRILGVVATGQSAGVH